MSLTSPSSRSTSSRLRYGTNSTYSSCFQSVAMIAAGGRVACVVMRTSRTDDPSTPRRSITMPSRSAIRSQSPPSACATPASARTARRHRIIDAEASARARGPPAVCASSARMFCLSTNGRHQPRHRGDPARGRRGRSRRGRGGVPARTGGPARVGGDPPRRARRSDPVLPRPRRRARRAARPHAHARGGQAHHAGAPRARRAPAANPRPPGRGRRRPGRRGCPRQPLGRAPLGAGGKAPDYGGDAGVADQAAAAAADGAFYTTGRSGCAVERVYAHERVWPRFVEAFVATVRGYVVGDPFDERTYIGPLARREAALAHQEAQVADAVARGARVLTGGRRVERPGFFFAPTVLVDVDHTLAVMREETFGPLIGLARAGSADEAVALMNDTPYGLTAAVYTADRARAERVLARVNTGTAYWNCCDRVSPRLPWTGRGASGLGVTLSREGIAAFLRPKAWHLRGV